MILQPVKTTAAAPVAPALPQQTDSKVSQELLVVKSLLTAAFTSRQTVSLQDQARVLRRQQ